MKIADLRVILLISGDGPGLGVEVDENALREWAPRA